MQPDAAPLGVVPEVNTCEKNLNIPALGHRGGDTCPSVWPQVRAVTTDKEKVMEQAGGKGEGQGKMGASRESSGKGALSSARSFQTMQRTSFTGQGGERPAQTPQEASVSLQIGKPQPAQLK